MVSLGIEELLASPLPSLQGRRVGLLCNQASVDRNFVHSRDLVVDRLPGQLTCLFSPQHGFFAEKQDNMIESDHLVDRATGLPVFSLYGEARRPTVEMFDRLDVLLIDLPDVGTRVYTFLYTMAYCLAAAAEFGKKVVVLDRPNPINGLAVEGNILQPECSSFVGLYPIPMRHGLTFGELAVMLNQHFRIGAELEVVWMKGWQRAMFYRDTGLPWVFPSPNMPTPETALVYPGQVIWEGTNISEGRGTCLPFELCGAPFWDPDEMLAEISSTPLPGCTLRRMAYEPTSNKWAGETCYGFHLLVTDPESFMPYRTSLALLQATMRLYPESFALKKPPYEYEYIKTPIDLILGSNILQKSLLDHDIMTLEEGWQGELETFKAIRRDYLHY
ncbi:MAG: DUF1343 domain-containing protein [Proteobacteria bacterium]|nr:DUF1343 domain-containing protein [Pseudomonadota bacterium]MBU1715932.1 DUF1343 domain-containing protein [Pseudomonadota bacterium]